MQIFNLLIGVVVVEGACVVFIVVVAVNKKLFQLYLKTNSFSLLKFDWNTNNLLGCAVVVVVVAGF